MGTENNGENNLAAQEYAIKEMAPVYTAVYNALDNLMTVNAQKAEEMDITLNILQLGALIVMMDEAAGMAEKLGLIVHDIAYLCDEMSQGNFRLRTTCEHAYVGEFNQILMSIRNMNRNMSTALREVGEAAEQVTAGSDNLAQASQDLAEGATDQAASKVVELPLVHLKY